MLCPRVQGSGKGTGLGVGTTGASGTSNHHKQQLLGWAVTGQSATQLLQKRCSQPGCGLGLPFPLNWGPLDHRLLSLGWPQRLRFRPGLTSSPSLLHSLILCTLGQQQASSIVALERTARLTGAVAPSSKLSCPAQHPPRHSPVAFAARLERQTADRLRKQVHLSTRLLELLGTLVAVMQDSQGSEHTLVTQSWPMKGPRHTAVRGFITHRAPRSTSPYPHARRQVRAPQPLPSEWDRGAKCSGCGLEPRPER